MIITGQLIWSDTFSGNMSKVQDHLAGESSIRAQPFLRDPEIWVDDSGRLEGMLQWCLESTTEVFLEVRAALTFTPGSSVGTGLSLASGGNSVTSYQTSRRSVQMPDFPNGGGSPLWPASFLIACSYLVLMCNSNIGPLFLNKFVVDYM